MFKDAGEGSALLLSRGGHRENLKSHGTAAQGCARSGFIRHENRATSSGVDLHLRVKQFHQGKPSRFSRDRHVLSSEVFRKILSGSKISFRFWFASAEQWRSRSFTRAFEPLVGTEPMGCAGSGWTGFGEEAESVNKPKELRLSLLCHTFKGRHSGHSRRPGRIIALPAEQFSVAARLCAGHRCRNQAGRWSHCGSD